MKNAIERANEYSEGKLNALRNVLSSINIPETDVVVANGSFARREASAESDIDYFIITNNRSSYPLDAQIRTEIKKIVSISPAVDGAFEHVETLDEMLTKIGGEKDNNAKMTRRMLLLLEGEWLFNNSGLRSVRRQILERYIDVNMTDHQLALFLLNDIVRYYRTVAIDYEFKTVEGENPKPWGIRNIKLVFSRKLLYASGLFSVAMTADRTRDEKITILEDLFDMPVIDRMKAICGDSQAAGVIKSYNFFLERLESKDVRDRLKALTRDERSDPLFRELKNEGHHFTREILKLFEQTFDVTHPIRRAIVF